MFCSMLGCKSLGILSVPPSCFFPALVCAAAVRLSASCLQCCSFCTMLCASHRETPYPKRSCDRARLPALEIKSFGACSRSVSVGDVRGSETSTPGTRELERCPDVQLW